MGKCGRKAYTRRKRVGTIPQKANEKSPYRENATSVEEKKKKKSQSKTRGSLWPIETGQTAIRNQKKAGKAKSKKKSSPEAQRNPRTR